MISGVVPQNDPSCDAKSGFSVGVKVSEWKTAVVPRVYPIGTTGFKQ